MYYVKTGTWYTFITFFDIAFIQTAQTESNELKWSGKVVGFPSTRI